jgi:phenylalanyl-tRNA synthetase beta chain
MRVPLSWLRTFVPYEGDADALAERLSLAGLAVEQVLRPAREIQGVIVGEVLEVDKHPDADSLQLVVVDDGKEKRNIVCGASNYVVGDKVPLAVPGSMLPGGIEIGRRKVRGAPSEGMLCSGKELGLGADRSGILILDQDHKVGSELIRALELDDEVLDIDVLPNRPDALSILGVAREVAALYGLELSVPVLTLDEDDEPAENFITVEVAEENGCPRYTARILKDVPIRGVSPWWIRRRLLLCGMRPIDPIVDATNHQMLEIGQPLHAFDLSKIQSGTIRVRAAYDGEILETLDGQRRELVTGDLLICDADRPIALAGVMGGADTEVSSETSDILLESATFASTHIAATSRRLDLRSEAAQRFERGVDPAIVDVANARCAALIAAVTGARVLKGLVAAGPGAPVSQGIPTTTSWLAARIGAPITTEIVETTLRAIGCEVDAKGDAIGVMPPSWRPDIVAPEDLSEEVARLYGYDRIPETLPSGGRTGGLNSEQRDRRRIRAALLAQGFDEAVTLSLLAPDIADQLSLPSEHPWRLLVAVANPLSDQESRLRPSLIPGLLEAAKRNAARRVLPITLFEIGNVFDPHGDQVHETQRCSVLLAGPARTGWHSQIRQLDVFDARGALDAIGAALGIEVQIDQDFEPPMPFHPARTGLISSSGQVVGLLGELHPRVAAAFELPERVALLDLDLSTLLGNESPVRAREVPKLPSVDRDIAIIVDDETPSSQVLAALREAAGELLESVDIFDRYVGPQIGEGKSSLAFTLTLRAPDRTLTDEDAGGVMSSIEQRIAAEGWSVRT